MAAQIKNPAMIIPQRIMTMRNKIIFWVATLWLSSGMLATGVLQLFKMKAEGAVSPPGAEGIAHLGYPLLSDHPGYLEDFGRSGSARSETPFSEGMGLRGLFLYDVRSDILARRSG